MEKFIDLLPHTISGILISSISLIAWRDGLTLDQSIKIIDVLIWPTVTFIAIVFFRKVFTYLFFSMDSFNFFGMRGHLRNVQEVIVEKANEMRDREKEEARFKESLDDLRNTRTNQLEKAVALAESLSEDNLKLRTDNREFVKQISALLSQIALLQRQLTGSYPVISESIGNPPSA